MREISADNYCIEQRQWRCSDCAHEFTEYAPLNYELVCFDGEDGSRYFLPMYGRNGYLELMERLIPEWDRSKPITPDIADLFLRRLGGISPVGLSPAASPVRCPLCGGRHAECRQRTPLHNHPVRWVRIDEEFLHSFGV